MLIRYEHELERAVKYPTMCNHCGIAINRGDSVMITQMADGIRVLCSSCTDVEIERIVALRNKDEAPSD